MLDPKTKQILMEHLKDLGIKAIELAGHSILDLAKNLAADRLQQKHPVKKISVHSPENEKQMPYHPKP